MPRAVLRNGLIYPIDPLPPGWTDGQELILKAVEQPGSDAATTDESLQEIEALAAEIDPEDDRRLPQLLTEIRREAKERARREAGRP